MSVNMKYRVEVAEDGIGYIIVANREIKTTFGVVRKGERGGFLLRGNELCQSGNCWVFPWGEVYDGVVLSNACVFGKCFDSTVSGNVVVGMNTTVFKSHIKSNALVAGKVNLSD